MNSIISTIIGAVIALFTRGNNPVEQAAGGMNIVVWIGGIAGIAAYFIGPGKDLHITLNAMEMGFILLVGAVAGEILARMKPPE